MQGCKLHFPHLYFSKWDQGGNSSRSQVVGICCPCLMGQGLVPKCKGILIPEPRNTASLVFPFNVAPLTALLS